MIENQQQLCQTFTAEQPINELGQKQNSVVAVQIHEKNPENATPDSRILDFTPEKGVVVNQSFMSAEPDEGMIMYGRESLTSEQEGNCQIDIADEVIGLSVHSKAINTSYINLKGNNVLYNAQSARDNISRSEVMR